MKYATWNLNFTDPNYGTGPEQAIADQGFRAEAAWSNGPVETGATILGYVYGEPTDLAIWNYQELTQDEALAFALQMNPNAYLTEDGRITAPREDN